MRVVPVDHSSAARRDIGDVLDNIGRHALVMGILNVTPDSFSDGGRFETTDLAVAQAVRMAADGADIIDVGGESTRPGFAPVSAEEEWRRIGPVIERLVDTLVVPISVDTMKAEIAGRASALGVTVINDIWGLQGDRGMAEVVASAGATAVVMHNRHEVDARLDILDDIRRFFDASLKIAEQAGIPRAKLILDPGIGFGKTPAQQLQTIQGLRRLDAYGLPLLIGLSRKSFLGRITGAPEHDRLVATLAANLFAAQQGARIFRVHDVADHRAALKIFEAIRNVPAA